MTVIDANATYSRPLRYSEMIASEFSLWVIWPCLLSRSGSDRRDRQLQQPHTQAYETSTARIKLGATAPS